MPAKSRKQQQMMAIAEHEPEKLNKENKGVLKMSKSQMHDFAATKFGPKKGSDRRSRTRKWGS